MEWNHSNGATKRHKFIETIKEKICTECGFKFKPKKKGDKKDICYECRIIDTNKLMK